MNVLNKCERLDCEIFEINHFTLLTILQGKNKY